MELLYIALPVALLIAAGFLCAFIWAARDDQFDDLETPALRMLHDAPPVRTTEDLLESGDRSIDDERPH